MTTIIKPFAAHVLIRPEEEGVRMFVRFEPPSSDIHAPWYAATMHGWTTVAREEVDGLEAEYQAWKHHDNARSDQT